MMPKENNLVIPVTDDLVTAVCGYYDDANTHALEIESAEVNPAGDMLLITGKLIMPDGIASMEGVITIPIKGPDVMGKNIAIITTCLIELQMEKMRAALKSLKGTVLDPGKE